MRWCLEQGRDLHSDTSWMYGFTGQLSWGDETGKTPIRGGKLHAINLAPVSWTHSMGDTSGEPEDWDTGVAALYIGGRAGVTPAHPFRLDAERVYIDCRGLVGTGIRMARTTGARWRDMRVDRAVNCGMDLGEASSGTSATDCSLITPHIREAPWGTAGFFASYLTGFSRAPLVAPPASSAAAGLYGQRGIGTDYRIYEYDSSWRRSAVLTAF